MALDKGALKGMIVANLKSAGFTPGGSHGMAERMAKAIADAVVDHIQAAAAVNVDGGSSAGTYKVE